MRHHIWHFALCSGPQPNESLSVPGFRCPAPSTLQIELNRQTWLCSSQREDGAVRLELCSMCAQALCSHPGTVLALQVGATRPALSMP